MRKIIGIACIALAALVLIVGISAGGSTLLVGIVVAVVLGLVGRNLINKQPSQTQSAAPKSKPTKRAALKHLVYVTDTGSAYHDNSVCNYIFGKEYKTISIEEARKRGLKPCKSCFPYGD